MQRTDFDIQCLFLLIGDIFYDFKGIIFNTVFKKVDVYLSFFVPNQTFNFKYDQLLNYHAFDGSLFD